MIDEEAVTELILYIENDGKLWGPGNTQGASIRSNIDRRIRSGTLNKALVPKLFSYLIDAGAKSYSKEYGGVWNRNFTPDTRKEASKRMAENYLDELDIQASSSPSSSSGAKSTKGLTIIARRWFNTRQGNTYHSVLILDKQGNEVASEPFEYGFGHQYEETAKELLKKAGYKVPARMSEIKTDVEDVKRKRDL